MFSTSHVSHVYAILASVDTAIPSADVFSTNERIILCIERKSLLMESNWMDVNILFVTAEERI